MIEAIGLKKNFGPVPALCEISMEIREDQVFGLIGSNGAGKSTLLRLIAGVLRPDKGEIRVDGEAVYDRPAVKERIFFISDEGWFFRNAVPRDVIGFYAGVYPGFEREKCLSLLSDFGLDPDRRISNFSKGMKKQLSVLLGISSGTKYLLCDETFDGLDPVMKEGVKSLFAREMKERPLTPVIASHNLRELQDICQHVGILHRGGVLLSEEMSALNPEIQRVQLVLEDEEAAREKLSELPILRQSRNGSVLILVIRGKREEVEEKIRALSPRFFELLPLGLEELFISETEDAGYELKKILSDGA